MLAGVRYLFRVRALQRQARWLSRCYDKDRAKARTEKATRERLEEIARDEQGELDLVADEIAQLHSGRLIQRASALDIPLPDFNPVIGNTAWTESHVTGKFRLSDKGRAELRTAVEAAAKARREALVWWVPILFGLIGALTGLASVLKGGR